MKRNATMLQGGRLWAAMAAFTALFLALTFSIAPAFAEETAEGASGEVSSQVGAEESQRYVAILYSDGELVIKKAETTAAGQAQGGPAIDGQGESQAAGDSANDTNNGTANEKKAGNGSEGGATVAGQSRGAEDSSVADGRTECAPTGDSSSGRVDASGLVEAAGLPECCSLTQRTVVATYDDVQEEADRADHVKWYGNRDKITRVTFDADVVPETMAYWFADLWNLSEIDMGGLDTSQTTSMQSLFDGCKSLKAVDTKRFNTSKVTNMSRLFAGCSSLTEIDLSSFDTSHVTTMDGMFAGCSSVKALNLSGFDASNVKSTDGMLEGCTSLAALDASSFSASQLSAMSVPTDNKGGFWRFTVPADFQSEVVLRAPTAEERAAAGLPSGDSEEGAKQTDDLGGGLVPKPSGKDDKPSPAFDSGKKNTDQAANAGVDAGIIDAESAEIAVGPKDTDAVLAAVPDRKDEATPSAQNPITQVIDAVSGVSQGVRNSAAMTENIAISLLATALKNTVGIAAAMAYSPAGVTAVVDSLANAWPSAPMTPFGVPLSLVATILLLLVAVPTTILLLRDHRS